MFLAISGLWPLFGLCRAFLARSGPCSGWVLSLRPQLVSCVPLWVVLALVWAESSACVLSLCPAGLFGSLWPLFGLCPQPVSSACVLPSMNDAVKHAPGRSFFLFFTGPARVSGHFWPLALIWALSCLSGSLWPLFGLGPQPASSACVLCASLGRSGPCLG